MSLFGKKTGAVEELSFAEKLTSRTSGGKGGLDLTGMYDESRMARYKLAIEKKALLFDKEDKHGVDYTHMDFILSTGCGFHKGMSNLVAVQLFWKAFYPYLKNVVEAYERFYDQFRGMVDDQEEVLSKHAELDFKYKWTREFLKQEGEVNGKSLAWRHQCFIDSKIAEAKKANPVPEKRAVEELPDLKEKL